MQAWQRRLVDASALVAFLGLVFVVSGVVLWTVELAPAADTTHAALYDLVVHVLFGGVVLALGVHVERSELVDEERFSVMAWCYGGFTEIRGGCPRLQPWEEADDPVIHQHVSAGRHPGPGVFIRKRGEWAYGRGGTPHGQNPAGGAGRAYQ